MKPIFTSLTPNAQFDDILLGLSLLGVPGSWRTGKSVAAVEQTMRTLTGAEHVFSFDSGRTSLFAILKSLELAPDSEVLLQAFTCVAVPGPVLWAGLTPIYIDCDKETLNMSAADLEKKITPRSKVLIIQHTFGVPADLDKLIAIAKVHGLFVIEDCAHALGASYHGQPVGSFGDAAFFSFGRDKVISSTFGGVAVVKDKAIAERVKELHDSFPLPTRRWIVKQLVHPHIMGKSKFFYNFFGLGKATMKAARALGLTTPAVFSQEKHGGQPPFVMHKFANALALVALGQLHKLEHYNEHRRKIARLYRENLHGLSTQTASDNTEPVWLRFTVRHAKRDDILRAAKKENIFLGDWYTTAIAPEGVDYAAIKYNPATCPAAEAASRQTFNLPTDIHSTEHSVHRIIAFLSKWK